VCWDLLSEFWVMFGLLRKWAISCGDYTCFVRLSLSDYLYVGLDVLIWSYVFIHSSPLWWWWWCFVVSALPLFNFINKSWLYVDYILNLYLYFLNFPQYF
jgi:hypothetical protein